MKQVGGSAILKNSDPTHLSKMAKLAFGIIIIMSTRVVFFSSSLLISSDEWISIEYYLNLSIKSCNFSLSVSFLIFT